MLPLESSTVFNSHQLCCQQALLLCSPMSVTSMASMCSMQSPLPFVPLLAHDVTATFVPCPGMQHCYIIECPLSIYPHQALPPLPSVQPCLCMCVSSQCQQLALAHKSHVHIHVGSVSRLLVVSPRHHSIILTRQQCIWWHVCTGT
jgi:hypothetical protein